MNNNKERFEAGFRFALKDQVNKVFKRVDASEGLGHYMIEFRHFWDKEYAYVCNCKDRGQYVECYSSFLNTIAKTTIRYEHMQFEKIETEVSHDE